MVLVSEFISTRFSLCALLCKVCFARYIQSGGIAAYMKEYIIIIIIIITIIIINLIIIIIITKKNKKKAFLTHFCLFVCLLNN